MQSSQTYKRDFASFSTFPEYAIFPSIQQKTKIRTEIEDQLIQQFTFQLLGRLPDPKKSLVEISLKKDFVLKFNFVQSCYNKSIERIKQKFTLVIAGKYFSSSLLVLLPKDILFYILKFNYSLINKSFKEFNEGINDIKYQQVIYYLEFQDKQEKRNDRLQY